MSTSSSSNRSETTPTWQTRLMPTTYTPWVKSMGYAVVIANIVLIITGGIVRLTGSGLGCDTWPRCTTDGSWTTTPEAGIHGIVEFGNRMLTFALIVVTILTFLSVVRIALPQVHKFSELLPKLFIGVRARESSYADLFNLTLLLLWGIPLQAVVGGVSVWQKLNPWMITAHFYLTAIMIALAAIYLNRVLRYFEGTTQEAEDIKDSQIPQGSTMMRSLAWVGTALVAFLVFMGTIVTGTGPHAGDPTAHRHPFDPWVVTRTHSISVWLFCVVVILLFMAYRKYNWPRAIRTSLVFVLALLVYQGIVGYVQFFNGLPIWLVELHLLGSGFFIWTASSLLEKLFVFSSKSHRRRAAERIEYSITKH